MKPLKKDYLKTKQISKILHFFIKATEIYTDAETLWFHLKKKNRTTPHT